MWWPYRNLVTGRVPESYWPGLCAVYVEAGVESYE
jgi:hypothetical protein